MPEDEPAGRIAAHVVAALPRRARIRAIVCQLLGAVAAAITAAGLVTPLAFAILDRNRVDALVLFSIPVVVATIVLVERGKQ